MTDAGKEKSKPSLWRGFFESVIVIVIGIVIAYAVRYYSLQYAIPFSLDLPIFAVITLVVGYLIIRIFSAIIWRVTTRSLGPTRGKGAKNFFQIVGAVVLVVVVFGLFGFSLTNWLIGAGFLGIVLGLAAQQVLGNVFAGIAMLFSKPFDIGDRITLITSAYGLISTSYPHENLYNGYTGVVKDIGIFYTRIFLDEGVPAVLPNSVVISSLMLNHTRVVERTVRVRMDLDKGIDYSEFKKLLLSALEERHSETIFLDRTRVEIVDVGQTTYQIVIISWARSAFEEPVKSKIIQEAVAVQKSLAEKKQI